MIKRYFIFINRQQLKTFAEKEIETRNKKNRYQILEKKKRNCWQVEVSKPKFKFREI